MKTKSVFLIMAACVLTLAGCKDEEPKYGAPVNIRVAGVMGRLDLDAGLRLGLFVGEPVNADNSPMTVYGNGMVLPDGDLNWALNQSQSSRFLVYAPYNPSYTGQQTVTFDAPSDQSTAQKMLEGNLLMGVSSGNPRDNAVNVKLKHAMTAMNVSFDNRSGSRIESLSVGGFMNQGELDFLTGTLQARGGKGTITPMRSPTDDNSYSFIYIPQDVTPIFQVKLVSGKTMTFTFDNYCHQYPGSVIRIQIQIDESTPEANILKLNGVNISQWTSNGIPSFTELPTYIYLNGLRNVSPDANRDGFFSAYLRKVTVTAVDRTSANVLGIILEDSTAAIHVWANDDSPLEVGNTIVGPVLGLMNKSDQSELHISHFYTSYATIGKTGELPLTEGTFRDVSRYPSIWEYRRMHFTGVTLQSGFSNDRAVMVQDGARMSVVCPGVDIQLADGAKGNLTGFPIRSGSDVMIMVYDKDVLYSFSKEAVDNALTRQTEYGLYDVTLRDTALFAMEGADMQLQHSVRQFEKGRTMQVADTRNGEVHWFLVYDCIGEPLVGHEYTVAFNTLGRSARMGFTASMECIKTDESRAWFVDRQGDYGFVMAL